MLYQALKTTIDQLDLSSLCKDRRSLLSPLIEYINNRYKAKKDINLNFICTHNSRRSHMAQIWAQTFSHYFGISSVFCFSGGTEITSVYPMVIRTFDKMGFEIKTSANDFSTVYNIKFASNHSPILSFSKLFNHPINPKTDFAAILTCARADTNCPLIPGAESRISLPYEDPKIFDNTLAEERKYLERSLEIAAELKYVFSNIKI